MRQDKQRFETTSFYVGAVKVEPMLRRVTAVDGAVSEVSQRQLAAIVELAQAYDAVVSRAKMHEILCLTKEGLRDRGALSQHIGIIRRAFGDSSKNPSYIKTVRGQGYYLMQEPTFSKPASMVHEPLAFGEPLAHRESSANKEPSADKEPSANKEPSAQKKPSSDRFGELSNTKSFAHTLDISKDFIPSMSRGSLSLIISVIVAVVLVIKTSGAPENQKDSQFSEPNFSASENSLAADTYSDNNVDSDPSIVALEQRYQDLLLDDEVPAEQKIEQLMAVGNALMCRQNWDASARAFNAALVLQRQQEKLNPLGLVITLTRLAQVKSVAAQSIDDSRELIIEATRLLRDHQPAPKAHQELLGIHAALLEFGSDFRGAESLLNEALSVSPPSEEEGDPLTLHLQTRQARILAVQSKFEEAEAVLKAVLQVRASGADRDGLGMVRTLHEYGFLLSQQGLHEKAAAKYQKALSILQRNHASQLSYVFKTKISLAESLTHTDRAEQAIPIYTDIIRSSEQRYVNDPVRLSHLKLRLSDALIKARQPVKAYEQVKVALNLIENQDNVPDWLRYSAKSLHGATLIELGRCAKGMRLLDNSVDEMFLDRVTDPRIASKIHARKNRYQTVRCEA